MSAYLPSNPFADDAAAAADRVEGAATALLTLAYEQRTANLIAFLAAGIDSTGHAMGYTTRSALAFDIMGRLGR